MFILDISAQDVMTHHYIQNCLVNPNKEVTMTLLLSATDVVITRARELGTLRVEECWSERLQEPYWAICDDHGVIEVALSEAEARERIQ